MIVRSILSLIFLVSIFFSGCQPKHGELYIAPYGDDSNPGTLAKPFLTPERARDAVREMRKSGRIPAGGMTIWFRGGDYICTKTLELNSDDSGTSEAPLVWQAYANERARLLGGKVIRDFQPLKDEAVRERLDKSAKDKVLFADLKAQASDCVPHIT
jgi:hypothetical protein